MMVSNCPCSFCSLGECLALSHLLKTMKKILPFFLSLVVTIYQFLPTFQIKADTMPTSSQYEQIGAFAFSQLLQSGEATELDFSDYTGNGTDFLIDLGQALFTGDFTGLIQYGLDWLGNAADNAVSSIQDSVHQLIYNMSPSLYNAWYGDVLNQSYVELQDFDKTNHLGYNLRELFTPKGDNTVYPNPNPDFSFITNINHLYMSNFQGGGSNIDYLTTSWGYYQQNALNRQCGSFSSVQKKNVSFCGDNFINLHSNSNPDSQSIFTLYEHVVINIYSSNNGYTVFYSNNNVVNPSVYMWQYNNNSTNLYQQSWSTAQKYVTGPNNDSYKSYFRTDFNDLSTCINYIYQHWANVDIYVDGNLWVLVNTPQPPTYPVVIPDTLTIWDGQQLNYQFPDNTYIDLSSLTNIIRTAINNSDVVHWSDIESTYVDINGQQAVAVTRIYRNDDDNLYIEQYQNITLPKFSHNQISILGNYVNPVTQVVEESTDVLPTELVTLFKVAIILMLFACIVHRLLE